MHLYIVLLLQWQVIAQLIVVFVWSDVKCFTSARLLGLEFRIVARLLGLEFRIVYSFTAAIPRLWPLDVVRLTHTEFYLAAYCIHDICIEAAFAIISCASRYQYQPRSPFGKSCRYTAT